MELAEPRASQAVLIGAASYRQLAALPAVAAGPGDLRDALTDPEVWGLPPENCTVVADETDPPAVSRVLRRAAAATGPDGLFLVYYAGHALAQAGELVLALPETDPEFPDEGGLPYEKVRRAVRSSPAGRRMIVLDCQVPAAEPGPEPADRLADGADVEQTCLLVAAATDLRADAPHTPFTGALLTVLREGVDGQGPLLTVRAIEAQLRQTLTAAGRERPELRERNSGGSIPLARNLHLRRQDLTGAVLLAGRDVTDGELRREAILVLRHNQTGALGVRLTRPAGALPESLHAWRDLATAPGRIFDGGPVAKDGFIALVLLRAGAEAPLRFTAVRGRLGSLPLGTPLPQVRDSIADLRVFSGYLGWGPGRLETLLEDGALRRVTPPLRTPFSVHPQDLWPRLQTA